MNLETQVKHYDKEYRNGNALITDKEFNKLERNLKAVHPDCDYFNKKLVLPSLHKDAIEDFIEGLPDDTKYILEPKIDGCAVAIEYRDGKIHKAITRKGKDIKDKMIRIRTVPLSVPTKDTIQIRGELYTHDTTGTVSQSTSAGYLRSKSLDPNPNLTFAAFQIINGKLNQDDTLLYLKKLGFHTTGFFTNADMSLNWMLHYKHCLFSPIYPNEYPIDGWVLKINDYKLQQTRPDYWQMAIKY